MASFNKVVLLGNLGNDVEVRKTEAGQPVANFSVATNEAWTDKEGKRQEKTEWHRVVAWGKLAELCGKYLAKGSACMVEGRLQTREWLDKQEQPHLQTEVVANTVQFLGRPRKGAEGAPTPGEAEEAMAPAGS